MRNTLFDAYHGLRLPREIQLRRIRQVMENELTRCQREVIIAYYFQMQSIPAIALARGVNKSTVCRTLRRAEEKIRLCLKY